MTDQDEPHDEHSKRAKFNAFLKGTLATGSDGLLKGKLALEHSLGLGPKPNVVPDGVAAVNGDLRTVEIGWHPVGGLGGKWFAEKTGLGRLITKEVRQYPDPSQHWAVLVGEYVHELWMDEHLNVIYINETINRDEWHTYAVGQTRFNDQALKQAGEMVIHQMRTARPAYNLISNNCQTFAVAMLDAIQLGAHRQFATSFAVYQRVTGLGNIQDLFVDQHPDEQVQQQNGARQDGGGFATTTTTTGDGGVGGFEQRPGLQRHDTVGNAQAVMEAHTTKVDSHHSLFGR